MDGSIISQSDSVVSQQGLKSGEKGGHMAFTSHCHYDEIMEMALSCCLQIKHMMAFIEQEANEKAEEIDAKVKSVLTHSLL